jgi:hypothetical protein
LWAVFFVELHPWRDEVINDDLKRQAAYQYALKATHKRLEQAIPGSLEGSFSDLSLAAALNLLFLFRGEWGSVGDYITTQRALRTLFGDDLLWAEPAKTSAAVGLVQ